MQPGCCQCVVRGLPAGGSDECSLAAEDTGLQEALPNVAWLLKTLLNAAWLLRTLRPQEALPNAVGCKRHWPAGGSAACSLASGDNDECGLAAEDPVPTSGSAE